MKELQLVTSCIVHLADSANFKGITSNKRCSGLTGSCFESPNDTIHVTVGSNLSELINVLISNTVRLFLPLLREITSRIKMLI